MAFRDNSYHYSPNTLLIIEKFMNAAFLTTLQKTRIMENLRKGESIPISLLEYKTPRLQPAIIHTKHSVKRNIKRKKEIIVTSGAYEVPKFIPLPLRDREAEKEKLQNICSGVNEISDEEWIQYKKNILTRNRNWEIKFSRQDRIKELMGEINDRMYFLNQMEKFGLKRKYEFEIINEISSKVKQLEQLASELLRKNSYEEGS